MGRIAVVAGLIAGTIIIGWGLTPQPAWSQYYPGVGARITLSEVPEGQGTLIPSSDKLFQMAKEASGMELEALIRLEGGMSRKYERYVVEDGAPWAVTEQVLAPETTPTGTVAPEPVEYAIDGQPILLGMGIEQSEDVDWQPYAIATFLPQADGTLVELSRWPAGAQYSEGIYVLDLNSDGVLEVVLPWTTGVAGGGGVAVVAIVPTGGLAGFGETPEDSSLYSTMGNCSLLDYDSDGNWEIETMYPVLANWAGFYFSDLMVFDPKKWNWVSGQSRFPDYYAPELSFYRQLNLAAQRFAQDPDTFRTDKLATDNGFACQIDGEWYSLDAFCGGDEGAPEHQMIDWLAEAVTAMEPGGGANEP